MDKIKDELNEVFCSVFDNPDIQITETMISNDVVGWDSFSHMNLIAAIEVHFDIEFNQAEALGFKTVGELLESIKLKVTP